MKRIWLSVGAMVAGALAMAPAHAEKMWITGDGPNIVGNVVGHYFVPCVGQRVDLNLYPGLTIEDAGDQKCGFQGAGVESAISADEPTNDSASAKKDAELKSANAYIRKSLAEYRKKHPGSKAPH